MGMPYARLTVKPDRKSLKGIDVDFLVDSGAIHSLVPAPLLGELGIEPYKSIDFIMADGTKITRQVGDGYFLFQGDGGPAAVVFGEPGDEPLLGATTLESLGLVLNPFTRELKPMRMLLM